MPSFERKRRLGIHPTLSGFTKRFGSTDETAPSWGANLSAARAPVAQQQSGTERFLAAGLHEDTLSFVSN
jgi:hypothetical protein